MEREERGWSSSDDFVCPDCVADEYLKAQLATDAQDEECSFCGQSPAAPFDTLMEGFMVGVRREYDKTENVLYWADDVTTRYNSSDVVWDFGDVFVGDGLIEAVLESIDDDEWVPADFAVPHDGDALRVAWDEFSHAVKFETRYMVWLGDGNPYAGAGDVPVSKVLQAVADVVDRLGLVKTYAMNGRWWRAQPHGAAGIDHTATRLGTVPASLATQPNRMSPAGIPMFYGAADPVTAAGEVAPPGSGTYVTWAAFDTSRATRVVDFTNLPPIPSTFDPENGYEHHVLTFLHTFVKVLSSKARPDWEAVDYVPTQVLTEYFLRVHRDPDGPVDGLLYRSAVTGDRCVVLDVLNDGCVLKGPGFEDPNGPLRLGLVKARVETAFVS